MGRKNVLRCLASAALFNLVVFITAAAQAPPTVQFFMPDGSMPSRQLRFRMQSDDGRVVDIFFTDTKGKFLITRSEGLRANSGYTLTIESDGRTFDTTTVSFYHYRDTVYFVPVFLKPYTPEAVKPAGVIDLAEMDSSVPKEAREEYDRSMRAYSEGRAEDAIAGLRSILSVHPNYFRALNDLGVILMKMSRLNEAAASFEQAARLAPRVYYPRLNLAIIKTRQKKYKEAIALLEQLRKENPNLIEARVPLADALMADGRLSDAESHLRAALSDEKLDRDTLGNAHYLLGLLLNRKEKFTDAVQQLTLAVKALPSAPRIHLQLGGALLQLKRLGEAERELITAYQLGGAEMGAAQLLLGQAYYMNKEYEKAMRAFEQYLTDVPGAPNAAEIRGVIEKIKSALNSK